MKCSRCQKKSSPPNARFCVDCGYVLLQTCPNQECGHQALPVRAENPLAKCPACDKFLLVCPTCHRLLALGARDCPTTRCTLAKTRPVEPFAPHGGISGGIPVPLRHPWSHTAPQPTLPAWETASTAAIGGLATRYGRVVCWQGAQLHGWPCPKPGQEWPLAAPKILPFFEPFEGDALWPARQGLLLAHGNAYALHSGGAARVSLCDEGHAEALQSLQLREEGVENEIAAFDFIEFDMDAAPSPSNLPTENWAPHQVQWMAQAATSTQWLAVGQWKDELIGVQVRGADSLFKGQPWTLPPQVGASQWRELLVWDNKPTLRSLDAIWCLENGAWEQKFRLEDALLTLDGALPDETGLWIWGRVSQRLWVRHLASNSLSSQEVSTPISPIDQIFPFPTVSGSKITFFQTGQQNSILTLDLARPLDDPHRQQIPAALSLVWTTSVFHPKSGAQWLLFATDDGTIVRLWLMAQAPVAEVPWELMKFRPLRGRANRRSGASLAATLSNDALIVGVTGEKGTWVRSFSWP